MFQRLLVPLDGSRLAEAVLPLVDRLAGAFRSTVVLLYVLERAAPKEVHGDRHLTEASEANDYLDRIAAGLRAHDIPVEHHVHDAPEGDVARSIASHADEKRSDLIVLCTHGRGRMRDLLFGSIAQQVLNRGTTPVLLVRPTTEGDAPSFEPRTILVPLDATAAAEVALDPAQHLARTLNAGLHLVMVVATQDTLRGDLLGPATLLPSATRAALDVEEHHATAYLDDLAERLRTDSVSVSTEVRRGNTASALVDEAAEPGVGLVALATHGRTGLQATWAGSVTAQLLSRTRAPVLLLRTIER